MDQKSVKNVEGEAVREDKDKNRWEDQEPPDLDVLIREAEEKNYPDHVKKTLRKTNLGYF